jgi:hypothetical protein
MPLWKFDDLVTNRRLFFTRLRHIVDAEIDVFEGGLARVNFEQPQVNVDWILNEVLAPGQAPETVDAMTRHYGDPEWVRVMQEWVRDHSYINCWFCGEFESEHMWKQYVPDAVGVVVQATVRLLVASLQETPESIQMDSVTYYDPTADVMVPPDIFRTALYKHVAYSDEHEFRCYVLAPQSHGRYEKHPEDIGYWVPCDPSILIQRVRIPPEAPEGLMDQVRMLCQGNDLSQAHFERSSLGRR